MIFALITLLFVILKCCHSDEKNRVNLSCSTRPSYPPAGIPRHLTHSCNCNNVTKTCSYKVGWQAPLPVVHPVTGYLIKFYWANLRENDCFKVPKDERSFIFNKTTRGKDGEPSYYSYVVCAEPSIKCVTANYMYCPEKLEITNRIGLRTVNIGNSITFNFTFVGHPEPDRIVWKYIHDNLTKYYTVDTFTDNIRVTKGKSYTTLTIQNATVEHAGKYNCLIKNYFDYSATQDVILDVTNNEADQSKNNIMLIFGACLGISVFFIFISYVSNHLYRRRYMEQNISCKEQYVYISHCSCDEKEKMKIVKLGGYLQRFISGVKAIIDLTEVNAIHRAGGMAQWLPDKMLQANKILIILSKDYVMALQEDVNIDLELIHKVQAEYNIMKKMIFENCQPTDKFILVANGVKSVDFPDIFQGKSYYPFPDDADWAIENFNFIKIF